MTFALVTFSANSTIKIYTTQIEQINTPDQSSQYNSFLRKVERETPFKFAVEFLPMNRGMRGFEKNPGSCIFPFSKGEGVNTPQHMVLSSPIGTIELFAITPKNKKVISSQDFLKKKRVAVRSLYEEGMNKSDNIEYYFVSSEKQLFLMLEKGRVDYILASVPDIFLSFKGGEKEFSKKFHFDKKLVAQELHEYMACHKENKHASKLFKYMKSL